MFNVWIDGVIKRLNWSLLKIYPDSIWDSFKTCVFYLSPKGSKTGPTEESCLEDFWKLIIFSSIILILSFQKIIKVKQSMFVDSFLLETFKLLRTC